MSNTNVRDEYTKNGFVVLQGLFDRSRIENAAEKLYGLLNSEAASDALSLRYEVRKNVSGEYIVDRIDPVVDVCPEIQEMIFSDDLRAVLKEIFHSDITLLKDKMIFKDPGTTGYTAHQDFLYWKWLDIDPDKLFTVSISLSDTTIESGVLRVYPGLHHKLMDSVAHNPNGDLSSEYLTSQAAPHDVVLNKGDVLVFHSLLPHESGPNRSEVSRNILHLSFHAGTDPGLYKKYYVYEHERRMKSLVSEIGNEATRRFASFLGRFNPTLQPTASGTKEA